MAGIRIVEGVDPEDRVAFGLPAPRLLVAAGGVVLAMACWSAPGPAALRAALTVGVMAGAAGMAWGHLGGRPALEWVPLVAGFAVRRWAARRAVPPAPTRPPARGLAPDPVRLQVLARGSAPAPGVGTAGQDPPPFLGGTRRIAFFSLKGGVGRTTLATETATLLAHHGRVRAGTARAVPLRVALVDLDLDAGAVAHRLGLGGPSLADLLGPGPLSPERVRRALVRHPGSRLEALLAPPAAPADPDDRVPDRILAVVHALDRTGVQAAVLDLGPGLTPVTRPLLMAAHDVVVVLTPAPSAVHDAVRTLDAVRRAAPGARLHVVHNRSAGEDESRPLEPGVAARVASDPRFEWAERSHVPAVLDGRGPAPGGLAALAAAVMPGVVAIGSPESRVAAAS